MADYGNTNAVLPMDFLGRIRCMMVNVVENSWVAKIEIISEINLVIRYSEQ